MNYAIDAAGKFMVCTVKLWRIALKKKWGKLLVNTKVIFILWQFNPVVMILPSSGIATSVLPPE